MRPRLTRELLCQEAAEFAENESQHDEPTLYGVTDGKAIGTYFEAKFRHYLGNRYSFEGGNAAKGIDFPDLDVDVKVTSIRQPQSSCPFRSARQKIYGLGYSLLVFVYDKTDNPETKLGRLTILNTIFVDAQLTADYQTTSRIQNIIENGGNLDDLLALFENILLPVDGIEANRLAEEILLNPPRIGYLTISNALQWRLQYRRIIDMAGEVEGILRVS